MANMGIVPNKPAATSTGRSSHPVTANSPHINPGLMQKLQSLIQSNPEYLTNGIPTQMLSQIVEQMNVSVSPPPPNPVLCSPDCLLPSPVLMVR